MEAFAANTARRLPETLLDIGGWDGHALAFAGGRVRVVIEDVNRHAFTALQEFADKERLPPSTTIVDALDFLFQRVQSTLSGHLC